MTVWLFDRFDMWIMPTPLGKLGFVRWIANWFWLRYQLGIANKHHAIFNDFKYLNEHDQDEAGPGWFVKEAGAVVDRMEAGAASLEYAHERIGGIRRQFNYWKDLKDLEKNQQESQGV